MHFYCTRNSSGNFRVTQGSPSPFLLFAPVPIDPINCPYETLRTESAIYPASHQRGGKDENTCRNTRHVHFDKEHCHLLLVRLSPAKSVGEPFYFPLRFSRVSSPLVSDPYGRCSRFILTRNKDKHTYAPCFAPKFIFSRENIS